MKRALLLLQACLLVCLGAFWIVQEGQAKLHSDASMDQIKRAMAPVLAEKYPEQDAGKIRRYFQLDPSQFDEVLFCRMDDSMQAEELVLAKGNPEALEDFSEAAETRKESQISVFEGYAPDQAAMTENAVLDVQENWALYYVGDQTEKAADLFHAALEAGK